MFQLITFLSCSYVVDADAAQRAFVQVLSRCNRHRHVEAHARVCAASLVIPAQAHNSARPDKDIVSKQVHSKLHLLLLLHPTLASDLSRRRHRARASVRAADEISRRRPQLHASM